MDNVIDFPYNRAHEYLAHSRLGFSYKEIAEYFGTTESIVEKCCIKYARAILKERAEAKIDDGPKPPPGAA